MVLDTLGALSPDECGCICNHGGACTGCAACWMVACLLQDPQFRALFGLLPGGLT